MSATIDDAHFSEPGVLRDGTPVTIRVMRPDDRSRLVTAFAKLDPESVYTRFFGYKKELSEEDLSHLGQIDGVHRFGLVVTLGAGADETIIGGASYVADGAGEGARSAEVAFTIEEDFHGQGLAGKLLAALAGVARRHGIVRFEADVLAGNAPMLAVFQRSGLPMTRHSEHGVVHVVLDLEPGRL